MKAIDDFMARVQSEGFNGYSPGKNDVLGDSWARKIGQVFDAVADAERMPKGENRHKVWLVWQWLYCELAGMRSRVIATPPACRAAGMVIDDYVVQSACDLLWKSQDY